MNVLTGFQPDVQPPALDPSLLTELAQAETHLQNGVKVATAQETEALAQSIRAIAREANDLARVQMRGLRRVRKISQAELARRVGGPTKVISDFEAGRRTLLPPLIRLLREAMGPVLRPSALRDAADDIRRARTALAGEATPPFEIVASGISMEPSIHHGDTLIVSKDVEPAPGRIVVAIHSEARIVKRLANRDGGLVLRSDNADEEVDVSAVAMQGVVVELRRTL